LGWGYNGNGELGGTVTVVKYPTQISGLNNVVAFSIGAYHSLALKPDGTVWGLGGNSTGQLGNCTKEEQEQDHGRKETTVPDVHRRIQIGSFGIAEEQRQDRSADRTRAGDHSWVAGEVAGSVSGNLERGRTGSFSVE
jgi:hypothetical protein